LSGLLRGRVAIVTGAGHGIGHGHALELAREGASVVVNDLGTAADGTGREPVDAAAAVVELIRARGGSAVADRSDVGDWDAARTLVARAVSEFGRLDVLVNNAGIQRKGGILEAAPSDWEAVLRVHLTGTFNCLQHAARHWRAEAEAGRPVAAAVINTTSPTSLVNVMPGIIAYVAAKGGVAALTRATAVELEPLGVRVNAISPTGLTRMTDYFFGSHDHREPDEYDGFDRSDPSLNAPLVAWLASEAAAGVTGQIFESRASRITRILPSRAGESVEREGRWDPTELGSAISAATR
jgi:NAD(P)-dependent dehydrogenase (short-subunit alcohol dehydrogenase family)